MKLRAFGIIAVAALTAAACDDPFNPTPQQEIALEEALDSPEEVGVAVNAMYDALQTCDGGYCRNVLMYPDAYAGNLDVTGTYVSDREVGRHAITAENDALPGIWGAAYEGINRANNVVASLPLLEDQFDADEYAALEGEARFVRALNYFTLVKFFGGVPLITEPRWVVDQESNVPRATAGQIWQQVEADLSAAVGLLPSGPGARGDGRANMEAAQALLARAHLYQGKWQQAYDLADAVIEGAEFSLVDSYAGAFENEQTSEAIFEIPFTVTDAGSIAFWMAPTALGGRWGFGPNADFVDTFEEDDERLQIAYQPDPDDEGEDYGAKYTDVATTADDVPVIRLAEVYLIRAEAAARLGSVEQALADVDVIRGRAGLDPVQADADANGTVSVNEALEAVLMERRHELFYEGHWFFDLKRFADVPSAGATLAELGLTGFRLLFPVPQQEIEANTELEQNPGY
jgi:tetratricopeptide (TPR) repeat protein